jgi:hypothetical protein
MVFTGPVPVSNAGHSRRMVLAAGLGVAAAAAGCADRPAPRPSTPPGPDPLRPLLAEAVALAGAYDRVARAQPTLAGRLAPLAADHRAHARELARLCTPAPTRGVNQGIPPAGPSGIASLPAGSPPAAPRPGKPSGAGTGTTPAAALAGLAAAERAAQRSAAAACAAAPADRAALLGSIAACRATHAEALR